jgi:Tfp pilus assembly protein PilO
MSVSNLSGRIAALLAAVVVLAVLLLGWFVLLAPQRSKISSLDNQIADTQSQIASTQAYVSSPGTKKAVARLSSLKTILPDDLRMSQILRQLSAAATVAGVQLDSITPTPPAPIGTGDASTIQLSVAGHYSNLSNFLRLLRSQTRVTGDTIKGKGRLYSVSAVQFNSGATGAAGANAITATVTLNVFVNGPAIAATPPTTTTTSP